MKLKTYQQGGGLIYTPFIPEQYTNASAKTSKSSSSDEDSKLDPLDKELLSLMKDQNLLPSDINQIFARLIAFQRKSQSLSDLGDGSYRSIMPGMLQIMQMVSNARYNKAKSDDAIRIMSNQNTGADVALDKYGRMYVQNENGEIKHIAPSEYDSDKYRPISNSELLYLRENSLPFDTDILSDISKTVGLTEISKEISRIINDFGKTKSEQYYDRDVVDVFTALNSPDGIYKLTEEKTSADLRKAWNVIYKQLPTKMQHVLNARAALTDSDPANFIHEIVLSNLDYTQSIDYDATQSKAAGLNTGDGSDGEKLNTHDTYPERIATGGVSIPYWEVIQTNNNGHKMYAYAQKMGPILKSGQGIGTVNLDRVLQDFDAAGIIDWEHVTFGDQKLDTIDFPKVVYDGGSQIYRVWLPTKEDGTVDFTAQQQMSDLQNWIDENGVINDSIIEERVKEIPNAKWNKDKKIIEFDLSKCKPFLVVRGIVSSDKVRFDPKSPYIQKMDKGEKDSRKDWLTMYNNAIATGISTEGKKKYDYGEAAGRHLYEGSIFMPITNEVIGALIYNDQWFDKSVYTDIRNKAESNNKRLTFKANYDE